MYNIRSDLVDTATIMFSYGRVDEGYQFEEHALAVLTMAEQIQADEDPRK